MDEKTTPAQDCQHNRVVIYYRLYAMATLYTPAEYTARAECKDCGEWLDVDDLTDETEIIDEVTQ